jgi:hypothetical protein
MKPQSAGDACGKGASAWLWFSERQCGSQSNILGLGQSNQTPRGVGVSKIELIIVYNRFRERAPMHINHDSEQIKCRYGVMRAYRAR